MIEIEILEQNPIVAELDLGSGSNVGASDHRELTGRDAEAQHPISSIDGLVEALLAKANLADLARVASTGEYSDLLNLPDLSVYVLAASLASVATSGDYADLLNKPTIPTIPTNVSAFNNDSGYLTLATLPIYDGSVSNGGTV